MSLIRIAVKKLATFTKRPMRIFLGLFFEKYYLTGRHFDNSLHGYVWAFRSLWHRNVLRLAPPLPFPASYRSNIKNSANLTFHPDDLNNFQAPGIYIQNFNGSITIGKGSYIGPNVGIITANHDPEDLDSHEAGKDVTIGEYCWIGMNSVILPGVEIGRHTIVGAGSIVTKSFPSGYSIIAGNPARLVREILTDDGRSE